MMHYRTFIFILSAFISHSVLAQGIAIGEWRDHLPYQSTHTLTSDPDNVYCASDNGLFYYNKHDKSLHRLGRVEGLSDVGIARISYNPEAACLFVGYSNSNIDLVKGKTIINLPDILNSSAVTPAEKTINNVIFIGTMAYVSCGFGVVVIDLQKEEVRDSWFIGPNGSHLAVNALTYDDTYFYAATASGLYYARRDAPNLAWFGSWTADTSLPDPFAEYNHIASFHDYLIINKPSGIWEPDTQFVRINGAWGTHPSFEVQDDLFGMRVMKDQLYLTYRYGLRRFDPNLEMNHLIYTYFDSQCLPRDVIDDEEGIWIADAASGLVKEVDYYTFLRIYPNGPSGTDVFAMDSEGDDLWVVPGGRNLSWNNIWKRGKIEGFLNGSWKTIGSWTEGSAALDSIRDLVTVKINPFNHNQIFAGSWYLGLVEFNQNQFVQLYTPENSSLEYRVLEGPPVCKIGGLAFDQSGNLWIVNSGANNILSVMMPGSNGTQWQSFYLGSQSSTRDIGELIIDSYGQKWIMWRDGYLIVFNDNGTPANPSDDQVKYLTNSQGNGAIPGNSVLSIAEDLDGEIWIGTDQGIAVIYSPENVFTPYDFDAQRILIPRNDGTGLADILLEFETITAIAVDGDNNKWIGTDRSGGYLVSDDGQIEKHHFTVDNSPLLSNSITDIVINHETGEVFFGTAKGIISYKSTATGGGTTNSDVYAYPNPVRPGYSGVIAIKGLVGNANVKITDAGGALVFSGKAEGGQAVWPGTNLQGHRVKSGVYLVFVTDDEGNETIVTKILVVN